ncbi:acyl-CoA dehydrogenase family protein [Solibacillus daqui]|uniref:acyl-CoA dehydrogenase family protein n=1 Tax=Solibacillus daqui TaxID=2912187 RepID=UPI00236504D1|nr:acyl-CoA dehydrogenase family protein [Solibacillus daqui]
MTAVANIQEVAYELAAQFEQTAVQRDKTGGNAKYERDLIRESGLLKLLIPSEYGGLGGNWRDVFEVVRIFARVDSSLAHVFGYHFVNLATPHLCGSESQKEYFYRETAAHNLFWGNAFNPVDIKLVATKTAKGYVLNGVKTFCSGSVDSDVLLVSAQEEGREEPLLVVIPSNRIGIDMKGDWDNMGQRQTDSGTIIFNQVEVSADEVLERGFNASEFSKLRLNIATFTLNHLYLGIAEGALQSALSYTKQHTRPRSIAQTSAIEDPIIQHHYGQFYVQIEAANLVVHKADTLLQKLWDNPNNITPEKRFVLEMALQTAKVFTTTVGLDITSRIFEVMGSRSTSNQFGFDRFWRNIRTMTLHVPVDTTIQNLGYQFLTKG